MSNMHIFRNDIEVPEIVQSKAEDVFSQIKMEGAAKMRKNENITKKHTSRKFMRPLVAVAACAVLFVTAGTVGRNLNQSLSSENRNPDGNNPNLNGNSQFSDTGDNSPAITDIFRDFTITAYAAEPGDIPQTNDGSILFAESLGANAGSYTGILFRIEGENIAKADISLDKGELYSATTEDTKEADIMEWLGLGAPDEDGDPDTGTIIEVLPKKDEEDVTEPQMLRLWHCTKRGSTLSDDYAEGTYYGFYTPDEIETAVMDEVNAGELEFGEASYKKSMETFEGGVLTVTIAFTDGSELTKEYDLSISEYARGDDGEILYYEGEPIYNYGVYAKERE